ncbi:MAG: MBL fold metallo-hydrolase [Endomicrobium sp.]|jgi:glyoxylase-like metal-dependent hydrolase (beta-lactamase superfamily II)|nr:MBL fold metallo-hydrolase [Endomicrobium sp.]
MIKVKKIISGSLDVNCYIVYDSETLHAAIIDPGEDGNKVIFEIEKNAFKPEILINTHAHFDHTLSDDKIRLKFKIPLAIHRNEEALLSDSEKNGSDSYDITRTVKKPDMLFESNQEVKLSFASFKVIHTPGHTNGSICLLFDGFLFTGDTLFAGTIGRTDFISGNDVDMRRSLIRLKKLDPSLIIYPGHGSTTTMSNELQHNPYLKD